MPELRKNTKFALLVVCGLLLPGAGHALLNGSLRSADVQQEAVQEDEEGRPGDGLRDALRNLVDGLRDALDRTREGLTETLQRFGDALNELLERLGGGYLEPVEGAEYFEIALEHQGLGRRVLYVRPDEPADAPAPAIVLLHYGNGTPERMARLSAVWRLAAEEGAWVVLPEAVNGNWRENPNGLNTIDDVGFLSAVIEQATSAYPIDPDRILMAGMSNGGFMAIRFACERPDAIVGLGLIAAGMRRQMHLQCPPVEPMSVVALQGTDDIIVPHQGRFGLFSAEEHFERWADNNNCDPGAVATRDLPVIVDDGTFVTETENQVCDGDSIVRLLTIEHGGHTWPGSEPLLAIGGTTGNVDATAELWRLLSEVAPATP